MGKSQRNKTNKPDNTVKTLKMKKPSSGSSVISSLKAAFPEVYIVSSWEISSSHIIDDLHLSFESGFRYIVSIVILSLFGIQLLCVNYSFLLFYFVLQMSPGVEFPEQMENFNQFAVNLRGIASVIQHIQSSADLYTSLKYDILKVHHLFMSTMNYKNQVVIPVSTKDAFYKYLQGANNHNLKTFHNYIWLICALNVLKHIAHTLIDKNQFLCSTSKEAFTSIYQNIGVYLAEMATKVYDFVCTEFDLAGISVHTNIGACQLFIISKLGFANDGFCV
jgi:hypothetical protein